MSTPKAETDGPITCSICDHVTHGNRCNGCGFDPAVDALPPATEQGEAVSPDLSALTGLVSKWRDAAVWEHESGDARQAGTWDQCADELKAALAGIPRPEGR